MIANAEYFSPCVLTYFDSAAASAVWCVKTQQQTGMRTNSRAFIPILDPFVLSSLSPSLSQGEG